MPLGPIWINFELNLMMEDFFKCTFYSLRNKLFKVLNKLLLCFFCVFWAFHFVSSYDFFRSFLIRFRSEKNLKKAFLQKNSTNYFEDDCWMPYQSQNWIYPKVNDSFHQVQYDFIMYTTDIFEICYAYL